MFQVFKALKLYTRVSNKISICCANYLFRDLTFIGFKKEPLVVKLQCIL